MDPSMMGGDPYGGGDPNAPTPEEQAVWQEFPGTDPGAILAVLSQGPDGVAQAISMVEQDYDILSHASPLACLSHGERRKTCKYSIPLTCRGPED